MTMPVRPGDVLVGKYRVEHLLGQGGMGVVVAARHVELGELFAIKFLLPAALENPQATDRFVREARAAAKLRGPHVAKVHDVGRLESGAPYMVMEYLEGTDLRTVVRSRGPLPIDEAITYVLQACEAIAEAHAVGIVHRDVKPANLFMTRTPDGAPWLKVLDFGISKQVASESDHDLTATGMILGSPQYMSPEQLLHTKEVDARADIWSLGVVLYQLLTGTTPFHSETLTAVLGRVLQEEAAPPSRHRPDLPPALDAIVLRCLEKRRENRFATMSQLAAALRSFHSGAVQFAGMVPPAPFQAPGAGGDSPGLAPGAMTAPGAMIPPVPVASATAARPGFGSMPGTHTAAAWGQTGAGAPPVRSRMGLVVGVIAGMALLGGGGLWLALRARSSGTDSAAASSGAPASVDAPVAAPAVVSTTPVSMVPEAAQVAGTAAPASSQDKPAPSPAASTAIAMPAAVGSGVSPSVGRPLSPAASGKSPATARPPGTTAPKTDENRIFKRD